MTAICNTGKYYIKGTGKTGMTQEEYLKSDRNPINNPKYQFKKGHRLFLTPEVRKKIGLKHKGKKSPWRAKMNRDPEFIKKCLKGLIKKPNKPENTLIELFKENNLPYKYVGDGEVIIGHWNPDFINNNGQKKIIELYGDYWHNLGENINRDKLRLKTYTQYGFKTLIIWEKELKDIGTVLENVKQFNEVN